MKCTVCKAPAVIDVRRHNANFCADHFVAHCEEQVRRAIEHFRMVAPTDRVLVAVSGGKDSLALWDLLVRLGYDVDGLYVGLGIGEYSDVSGEYARSFASARGVKLLEVDLRDEYGFDVPTGAKAARRVPCSACGLSKRHLFDKAALDGGYDVVATGHNLDDEAAVLFGNVLHWQMDPLSRQSPALASTHPKLARRVKPLYRLSERETAAYAFLRGIDYIVDECPFAKGATSITHKQILDRLEEASPGAKHNFLFGFLEKARGVFEHVEPTVLNECAVCGQVTTGEICAFCKLGDQVKRRRA